MTSFFHQIKNRKFMEVHGSSESWILPVLSVQSGPPKWSPRWHSYVCCGAARALTCRVKVQKIGKKMGVPSPRNGDISLNMLPSSKEFVNFQDSPWNLELSFRLSDCDQPCRAIKRRCCKFPSHETRRTFPWGSGVKHGSFGLDPT